MVISHVISDEALANRFDLYSNEEKRSRIESLSSALDKIENDKGRYRSVDATEITRRRNMLQELQKGLGPPKVYGGGSFQRPEYGERGDGLSMVEFQQQQLAEQDIVLDAINTGVDRLHGRALTIKDESTLSVKLLDDIDNNVDSATIDLSNETRHAVEIRRKASNFPLYVCIIVLIIILVFLLIVSYR